MILLSSKIVFAGSKMNLSASKIVFEDAVGHLEREKIVFAGFSNFMQVQK
jgi:hypothetical protein